jgi:protein TonB
MTTQFNSEENFNELIFENRNKDYGAYAIRSSYTGTVTKSMAITLTAVSLLVGFLVYVSKTDTKIAVPDVNIIPPIASWIEVKIQHPDKPDTKVETPKDPLPPKTDNMNMTASDDPTKSVNKTVEQMNPGPVQVDSGATDTKPKDIELPPVNPPPPLPPTTIAEVMPQFEGDVYKFIRDHLNYPQVAVENGTQGTVFLSFVIGKDGTVGEVKVLGNKVGDGCTEEAIRVVKLMPKWRPGMNGEVEIPVIINLPVRFRLKS